ELQKDGMEERPGNHQRAEDGAQERRYENTYIGTAGDEPRRKDGRQSENQRRLNHYQESKGIARRGSGEQASPRADVGRAERLRGRRRVRNDSQGHTAGQQEANQQSEDGPHQEGAAPGPGSAGNPQANQNAQEDGQD